MREYKHRTTEQARQALSNFCKAVGTAGDRTVHIFTIPLDNERDADCILSDVISERDAMRELLSKIQGSLHVINHAAAHVRKWIKDPNVDVEGSCKTIEEYRLKIHMEISKLLFPEERKEMAP